MKQLKRKQRKTENEGTAMEQLVEQKNYLGLGGGGAWVGACISFSRAKPHS